MTGRHKKERISTDGDNSPLGITLGALLGREVAPSPTPPAPPPSSSGKKKKDGGKLPPRAILSRETRGRGGKTVTAISFRDGRLPDLEGLAKEIRTALGCGGTVEEDRIILQGNQVDRASDWLTGRGVRAIKGN
ncbi:MAG: translation initiation factor [Aminivibrio sp.]|jgi:translation initiation factor 1